MSKDLAKSLISIFYVCVYKLLFYGLLKYPYKVQLRISKNELQIE